MILQNVLLIKEVKLQQKNILIISPEPWEHIFVSKHHYATHLASLANKVFFLNPPSKISECNRTDHENLYLVFYKGFLKGLRYLPSFIQKVIIRNKFYKIQKLCQTKFDIIWSFDNSVFFDFSALPNEVYCISHIVDWNQDFEFKKASKTANLCLATTSFILEKQLKYNSNSHNIGHGFNYVLDKKTKFELKGKNKIKCGYAGNLDIQYIDWNLIESLLMEFPFVDFHFVGQWNSKANFPKIYEKQNFHYYGKIHSNNLPAFYKSVNILILVYLHEKYPEQLANPHKMMEYLASGVMILATWTEEYKKLAADRLILMIKSREDFIERFKNVIKDLEKWNDHQKTKARVSSAEKSNYKRQIIRIEKLL